jgi:hypothetical protein
MLSTNSSAIHLLERNLDKIDWFFLSQNSIPNAITFLEQHQDKIHWANLSENPNAISLLEQNHDKINWTYLSSNPKAVYLFEQNHDKHVSCNPGIFEPDYLTMSKEKIKIIYQELMEKSLHPSIIIKAEFDF